METQPQTHVPELLDYKGLTKYYSLPKSTMSKKVMNNEFCDVIKIGMKNYFRKTDVDAWIEKHLTKAGI